MVEKILAFHGPPRLSFCDERLDYMVTSSRLTPDTLINDRNETSTIYPAFCTYKAEPFREFLDHPDDTAEETEKEDECDADSKQSDEQHPHGWSVVIFWLLVLHPHDGKDKHQCGENLQNISVSGRA